MGKTIALCFAAAALAGLAASASAEETTVISRDSAPGVSVERHEGVVERREVTTGSVDCGSKTVHKEDGAGNSKTVHTTSEPGRHTQRRERLAASLKPAAEVDGSSNAAWLGLPHVG